MNEQAHNTKAPPDPIRDFEEYSWYLWEKAHPDKLLPTWKRTADYLSFKLGVALSLLDEARAKTPTYEVQEQDHFEIFVTGGGLKPPARIINCLTVLGRTHHGESPLKTELKMDSFKLKMLLRELLNWYFEDDPQDEIAELVEKLGEDT